MLGVRQANSINSIVPKNYKIVLYSFRRCPFAIRVRMVLEEKQIVYHIVEETLAHLSPELLSLHPEGKVPLLVHFQEEKPQVIYQSSIITEFLDDMYPQFPLMPNDPIQRAQIRLWTYWCDQIFKPDLDLFKYKLTSLVEAESLALVTRLHKHLSSWENALAANPFLVGDHMTLADIHLFPFARQFLAIKPPFDGIEQYTRLRSWLETMVSRPAFLRAMKK